MNSRITASPGMRSVVVICSRVKSATFQLRGFLVFSFNCVRPAARTAGRALRLTVAADVSRLKLPPRSEYGADQSSAATKRIHARGGQGIAGPQDLRTP